MTHQPLLFEIEAPARRKAGRSGAVTAAVGTSAVAASPKLKRNRRPKPQVDGNVQPLLHAEPYVEQRYEDEIDGVEDACWRLFREVANPYVIARFTFDGEPTSKSRPRFVRAGSRIKTYTPKETVDAESVVAWQFRQTRPDWSIDATSGFGVFGVFHAGTRQRRDVDNMLKLILDALNKVVWADDAQVVEVSGRVSRGGVNGPARTSVLIYRLPGDPPPTRKCEKCGTSFRLYKSTSQQRFCSRKCNGVLATARLTRTEHKVNIRSCARCGTAFTLTENQWHKKRYCSEACQHQGSTDSLTCVRCGKQFTQWTSWKPSGAALCSKECGVAYWRSNGTKKPKGTCATCSGPVSRREYENCRACVRAGTPNRSRGPAQTAVVS